MAMLKGPLLMKCLSHLSDHEVVMGKLRLGDEETYSGNGVIIQGGSDSAPIECTSDDHNFIDLRLKATPSANKSGNGLYITMEAARDLALYNRTIYSTIVVPSGKHPRNPHAVKALTKITDETSYVQGQTTAVTADMEFKAATQHASMGECSLIKAEAVLGSGAGFAWGAGTNHALLKLGVAGGDATGRQKWITSIWFAGEIGNKAAKLILCNADVTGGGGASNGGIQVRINNTQMWIPTYSI